MITRGHFANQSGLDPWGVRGDFISRADWFALAGIAAIDFTSDRYEASRKVRMFGIRIDSNVNVPLTKFQLITLNDCRISPGYGKTGRMAGTGQGGRFSLSGRHCAVVQSRPFCQIPNKPKQESGREEHNQINSTLPNYPSIDSRLYPISYLPS